MVYSKVTNNKNFIMMWLKNVSILSTVLATSYSIYFSFHMFKFHDNINKMISTLILSVVLYYLYSSIKYINNRFLSYQSCFRSLGNKLNTLVYLILICLPVFVGFHIVDMIVLFTNSFQY